MLLMIWRLIASRSTGGRFIVVVSVVVL